MLGRTGARACEVFKGFNLIHEQAMADGAPRLHEHPRFENNINTRVDWHFGDVEEGFAEADVVKEHTFVGNRVYQQPMEPHSATAQFFINVKDNDFLNHSSKSMQGWGYCVFGRIVEGEEVLEKIRAVPTTSSTI